MNSKLLLTATSAVALVFCMRPVSSQSSDIPITTSAYVLKNLTVISAPGDTMKGGSILLEDGLIREVGTDVETPVHARELDCEGMYAYAGFIEAISHTGIEAPRPGEQGERPQIDNPGDPPNDLAGIQPDRSAVTLYKSSDKSVKAKRELGFTVAHTVPHQGMLPGTGALVLLGDGEAPEMALKENCSLYAQFQPARRMYPATVIGVMAKWRDLYRQAELTKQHRSAFDNADNGGLERPKYDKALEGMFPVVESERPVFFKTPGTSDIHKAMLLQKELGFEMVLSEVDQAWLAKDAIAAARIPVLLTLDLPEDKTNKKKKGDEEEDEKDPETAALEKRQQEFLAKYYSQAAILDSADVPLAFSTLEVKERDLRDNLQLYIDNGLPEEKALAALTTVPAEMLGVSSYLGTLTPGKMANIVVTTDNYFSEEANVKYVFVEGTKYEYEIKEKKKRSDSDEEGETPTIDLNGSWTYEVDVMGQSQTGVLSFTGNDGAYDGTITNHADNNTTDLRGIEIDGTNVTFLFDMDMDGQSMTVEFDFEVIDNYFEGDVSVGQFGSFPIEGERDPR